MLIGRHDDRELLSRELKAWLPVPSLFSCYTTFANMAAEVDVSNLTEIEDIEKAYAIIQQKEVKY